MSRPSILLVSLGGTISMVDNQSAGATPGRDAPDFLETLSPFELPCDIVPRAFAQLPGAHLTIKDVVALGREIEQALTEGIAGVVVTTGTDTLEEVAFGLDLLIDRDQPIVVTGAMRLASHPGADGPANLSDAIRVAADPISRALGTLVVMSGEIHAARFVQKSHTANPSAFESVTGPMGWIVENRVYLLTRPVDRIGLPSPLEPDAVPPPVALVTLSLGWDERAIRVADAMEYAGLVLEALGGGHVPRAFVEALGEIAEHRPVVLSSRVGRGPILASSYGFPGSERDLLERGLVWGGTLDGPKAQVALALLLASGVSMEGIHEFFRGIHGPSLT